MNTNNLIQSTSGRDGANSVSTMLEKGEIYETPVIEIVEVRVEQGFQVSLPSAGETKEDDYLY